MPLTAMRSSHKQMVSLSQDVTVIADTSGGNAFGGRSRITTRGRLAGRQPGRGAGDARAGRPGRSGRSPARTAQVPSSPPMIRAVRASGLGVSSTSIAQTCPA